MRRERITVSLDHEIAARVRRCGATDRGGASGYLERLVRQDQTREAVDAMARFYTAHPGRLDADEAERIAAADERGETA